MEDGGGSLGAHNFTKTHPYKPSVGHPQEIVRLLFFEVV
jgi:hypothetical protein